MTGPVLRASGVKWDLRKAQPYAATTKFDFEIPTGQNGDTYDRYMVRMEEMRQSLRIIEQAVDGIPEGPIMAKVPKVIKPPVGEIYHSIEAPKGELGYFIVSDGSTQPYRVRVRPPSFVNLQASTDVPRPTGGRRHRGHRHAGYRARRGGPLMLDLHHESYLDKAVQTTPGAPAISSGHSSTFCWSLRGLGRRGRDELAGAQDSGAHAGAPRPDARGPARPAAAHRRCDQAAAQRRHHSREGRRFVFWLAPIIVVLAAFTVYMVVPFGPTHAITDMNIGILFMLGVSSLSVLGIVMAGWASNSHYPLIGALRSSAQMVSYEVAMGLAVVSAILMTSLNAEGTGTLSMIGIVQAQQAQRIWFIFKFFPLGLIAFFIFAVAMVAETNRAPFDLPEAESELTAGFHTEYSGFRWSLFFLARIFRDDRRVVDRGHTVAGRMAAAVPQLAERPAPGTWPSR